MVTIRRSRLPTLTENGKPQPEEAGMSHPALAVTRPVQVRPSRSSSAVIRGLAWTARAVAVAVTTTASAILLGPDMKT